MLFIFFTFSVLNLDKSKEVNKELEANILLISSTFEVSKLSIFILDNVTHFSNILLIVWTFEVSNLDKSNFPNALQS